MPSSSRFDGRILSGLLQLQCVPECAGQALNRTPQQFFTFQAGVASLWCLRHISRLPGAGVPKSSQTCSIDISPCRLFRKSMSAELIAILVSHDVKFALPSKLFI